MEPAINPLQHEPSGIRMPSREVVRKRASSTAIKGKNLSIPTLSLPVLKEEENIVKSPRKNMIVTTTPYELLECFSDSQKEGPWLISYKHFPPEAIEEILRILDIERMQKKALKKIEMQLETNDIGDAKEANLSTEATLTLTRVKLLRLVNDINKAIGYKKNTELQFLFCRITPALIEGTLSGNLKVLHLEHGILDDDLCKTIGKSLVQEKNPLNTLRLINMGITPCGLAEIVNGNLARNRFSSGVENISLAACQIDAKFHEILKNLIGKSKHLIVLDLEANELGSASKSRRIATLMSRTSPRKVENNDLAAVTNSPSEESLNKKGVSTSEENLNKKAVKICINPLVSIVEGTVTNIFNGGKINKIILADNGLTAEDLLLLTSEEGSKNMNIEFNVGKNNLYGKTIKTGRLCFESPRSNAIIPIDKLLTDKSQPGQHYLSVPTPPITPRKNSNTSIKRVPSGEIKQVDESNPATPRAPVLQRIKEES